MDTYLSGSGNMGALVALRQGERVGIGIGEPELPRGGVDSLRSRNLRVNIGNSILGGFSHMLSSSRLARGSVETEEWVKRESRRKYRNRA